MTGLIPQNFIDDLLERCDIVDIIDKRVKLKRTGHNYVGLCPFHEEKTPSFSVNPDKQFYYCFGCGAGGNALGFLMEYERLEFPEAVNAIAHNLGVSVPEETIRYEDKNQQRQIVYDVLKKAADFYYLQLKSHPAAEIAVNYLRQRGVSGQIAKTFQIGYAPPGWDNLLKYFTHEKSIENQLLIDSGLVIEKPEDKKIYDRFRQRIIFPIRNQRGKVIAFGGRVLNDEKPKYLNSPETIAFHKGQELYGLYEARLANRQLFRLIIVEGYMDVVALAQHGITYAAATLGTATSEEHLQRVFRLTNEIIFCFDGDKAGRAAASRALETSLPLMEDGREVKFLFLPEGEDPDSLVRSIGKNEFEALLKQSTPLSEYLFTSLSADLNIATMDGRARLSSLVLPFINRIPHGVFHQLMLKSLATRTGLDMNAMAGIAEEILTAKTHNDLTSTEHSEQVQSHPRSNSGEKSAQYIERSEERDAAPPSKNNAPFYAQISKENNTERQINRLQLDLKKLAKLPPAQSAITMLLHRPELAYKLIAQQMTTLKTIEDLSIQLLAAIIELLRQRDNSNIGVLLGHWYGTEEGQLLTQLATLERLIPNEGLEQEFFDTINAVCAQSKRQTLQKLLTKAKSRSFNELSSEEKEQLKNLLADKESGGEV